MLCLAWWSFTSGAQSLCHQTSGGTGSAVDDESRTTIFWSLNPQGFVGTAFLHCCSYRRFADLLLPPIITYAGGIKTYLHSSLACCVELVTKALFLLIFGLLILESPGATCGHLSSQVRLKESSEKGYPHSRQSAKYHQLSGTLPSKLGSLLCDASTT